MSWPRAALLALPALVFASACAAASAPTAATITSPDSPATPTFAMPTLAPSATPTATSTPVILEWLTYQAPTLAPFPISESEFDSDPPTVNGLPPSSSLPFALGAHDHFYFLQPVANANLGVYTPSQRYGVVQAAGDQSVDDPHLGLDIGLDSGTPVRAAAGGTVVWASYGLLYNSVNYIDDPYGISVVIRHDFGFGGERLWTVYGHLSQASVKVGARVERGEIIGLSGNTGLSTGPHLHFEVRTGVSNVYHTRNPELWMAPPEGYGVLVGRVTTNRNVLLFNKLIEIRSLDGGSQRWNLYTYSTEFKLLPDPYYKENAVLGNLPAGTYEVSIPYYGVWYRTEVEIKPGAITYFHFSGSDGYKFDLPAEPPLVGVPN